MSAEEMDETKIDLHPPKSNMVNGHAQNRGKISPERRKRISESSIESPINQKRNFERLSESSESLSRNSKNTETQKCQNINATDNSVSDSEVGDEEIEMESMNQLPQSSETNINIDEMFGDLIISCPEPTTENVTYRQIYELRTNPRAFLSALAQLPSDFDLPPEVQQIKNFIRVLEESNNQVELEKNRNSIQNSADGTDSTRVDDIVADSTVKTLVANGYPEISIKQIPVQNGTAKNHDSVPLRESHIEVECTLDQISTAGNTDIGSEDRIFEAEESEFQITWKDLVLKMFRSYGDCQFSKSHILGLVVLLCSILVTVLVALHFSNVI